MTKKILFIRHGESESNAGGRTEHPQSIPLTATGHQQARDKAAALNVEPDLIVTSPYLRTHQTADPFIDRFLAARQEEWPVHEFTFLASDKYRNTTNDERKPSLMEYWNRADPQFRDGADAESFQDFVDRCRETVERMRSCEGDTVLIFSHGYMMNGIRYLLEGKFDDGVTPSAMLAFWDYHAQNKIDNCDTLEFAVDGGRVSLAAAPPIVRPGKPGPSRVLD